MFEQFLTQTRFSSYEDFSKNFRIKVPDKFNFAYDVVDRYAHEKPDKPAMVWCDDKGAEARFSFKEMSEASNKAANFFASLGIGRGDPVMLMLKRRYEYWFCLLALHKLGAIAVPATHILTKKDIVYRNNAASVKAVICVSEPAVMDNVDAAMPESKTVKHRITLNAKRTGWLSFEDGMKKASAAMKRAAMIYLVRYVKSTKPS